MSPKKVEGTVAEVQELTNEQVLAKLRENSARKSGSRAKNRTYTVKTTGNVNAKMSPQAVSCLEILLESGKQNLSESEVFELISKNGKKLHTKQDPIKIFQYYRKNLVDNGFLGVEVAKAE